MNDSSAHFIFGLFVFVVEDEKLTRKNNFSRYNQFFLRFFCF